MSRPVVAVDATARVGEGPVWDHRDRTLLWVDILSGAVHRSDLTDGSTRSITVPTVVGAAALRRTHGVVAATAEGFAVIDEPGLDTRAPFLPDGVRMNDAKVAPDGSFWAGSCAMDFAAGRGALHVLRPDWSVITVLDGLTQPNGMDWSPGADTFYLADTAEHVVRAYAMRDGLPAPDTARVLVDYTDTAQLPDGLCTDSAGDLWIALWGSGRVEHRGPDGVLLDGIDMPVAQPSSCAFGGDGLDRLIVTSAAEGLGNGRHDGSVFVVDAVGAVGRRTGLFLG